MTISVNGDSFELDEDASVVVRLPPGETVFTAQVDGEQRERRFQKHGSSPRFVVDFDAPSVEHPFTALPGLVGDRFRIDRIVARAPTGTVVKAIDLLHDRDVALRAPSDELAAQEEAHQVFVVEAKNLLRVEHPNLLALYDVLIFRGRAVLVTEWVEGDTLDQLMREGRVGPEVAWNVMLPIASGVARLHREDIVHRDLHGANIIVRPEGGAKLIDLGLARSLADVYLGAARVRDTREHYAPEQFQGLHVTPATDVYQLTLLFYRCWSGEWPYADEDLERAHTQELAVPLDAPEPLRTLVSRGLEKNPRRRFADAQVWFRDFSGAQELIGAQVSSASARSGSRRMLIVAIVAAFIAIAAVVFVMVSDEDEKTPVVLGAQQPNTSVSQAPMAEPAVKVGEPEQDPEPDKVYDDSAADGGEEAEEVPVRTETKRQRTEKSKRTVRQAEPVQTSAQEPADANRSRDVDGELMEDDDGPSLLDVEDGTGDSILLPVE